MNSEHVDINTATAAAASLSNILLSYGLCDDFYETLSKAHGLLNDAIRAKNTKALTEIFLDELDNQRETR